MSRIPSQAFITYRDIVPEEVRLNIQTQLLSAKMNGYDEFIACTQYIMSELAAANIPPTIAVEMRAYLELILTAISAKRIAEAASMPGVKPTASSIAAQMDEAKKAARKMRPALTMTDEGNGTFEFDVSLEPQRARVKK